MGFLNQFYILKWLNISYVQPHDQFLFKIKFGPFTLKSQASLQKLTMNYKNNNNDKKVKGKSKFQELFITGVSKVWLEGASFILLPFF